jgi:hypothetical protein
LGESLYVARDTLSRAIEILRTRPVNGASDKALKDLVTRLQFARNALVENESKIWLRTKIGKEMLTDFESASVELLRVMESGSGLEGMESATAGVERQAGRLNEETRRRSMVVT